MKHKDHHKHGPAEGCDSEAAPAAETPAQPAAQKPEAAATGAEGSARQDAAAPQASEEDKLRDRLLRLQADFDNYRKRVARDHAEMVRRANEDLVESLLPVLDHFGHAEASMEKDVRSDIAAYLEGFRLVRNELVRVLDSIGLKPVEALGLPFDATRHDALSILPSETAEPGTVLVETRKGYTLNGRVLRPAQVIVAAEDAAPDVAPADAEGSGA